MPTAYRVEEASTGRAVCRSTECKTNVVKIDKGELRFGTLVEIKEHQSWQWKHWGCVTPLQLGNWKDMSSGDMDYVDGYDDLSADNQAKVKRCIEQGHVDDADWKGDLSKNRPGEKGFKKSKKEIREDAEAAGEVPSGSTPKKRGRGKKADEEDDAGEPPKKKKATKSKKADEVEDVDEPAKKKPTKSKKMKKEELEEHHEADEMPAAPKAKPGRPKKVKAEDGRDEQPTGKPGRVKKMKEESDEETPVVAKRGRPKKIKPEEEKAPQSNEKKSRTKKAKVEEVQPESEADEVKSSSKKDRPSKTSKKSEPVTADVEKPAAKTKGRKKKTEAVNGN
ncbi:MAG: hypothetical protein M1828_001851 [Chrysothrix sp. TS-e1954]|nr:MAG: hypothetical protein M1828_001851 [Chrysothrix sp. TS-e1954]